MAKGEGRQFPPFNIIDLRPFQRPALLDSVPLLNASPATGGGGMLVFPKFGKFYKKNNLRQLDREVTHTYYPLSLN